ncbi:phosphoenolpyruvate hydrolase family protein [Actinoplanes bogorensis]|uniref:Phosphoenolpyruvate hydrolase family protein n=1 Tax=Paractinoplanes bogorensis TaxID=1610840 RepID=A0ABS5YKQ6_9ACTN|nr:phosphoenolpyruvate hydrolase family protein [Actinoplanes bogorensis]MBU2663621.1 phosphoenolpyruvate hydrolase family protein [Actinoplanes bogorensis]
MERTEKTRISILADLRAQIAAGKPVLAAGCSAGIIAKCAEAAGTDLIVAYSTGRSRLMGLPTTDLGDSNTHTVAMLPELDNVVRHTPIVGGMDMADPRYLRVSRLIDLWERTGFNGIINMPTNGDRPHWVKGRSAVGLGLEREAQVVALAREREMLTMGYALSADHARLLCDAGVDILVPHAGWTAGGLVGAGSGPGLEEGAAFVQEMLEIGRKSQPDVIVLAHGGPFAEPEQTLFLYEHTDAQGFVGASSIERLPVERAVTAVVHGFKQQSLRAGATS